jgi:hypothetical protein
MTVIELMRILIKIRLLTLCLCCSSSVIATNRRIFTALEQLKLQNEELKSQMHSQSALLQLLVGRYGGVEDAVSQLPDWLSLPCKSVQELQQLEGQLSDGAMRSNVVSNLDTLEVENAACAM